MTTSLALTPGCISPAWTRMPTCVAGDPYIERQVALTKDPYPDPNIGPDVSFRPADYQIPRAEPRQIKEKYFTWAKPQLVPSQPTPATSTSWILPPDLRGVKPQRFPAHSVPAHPLSPAPVANVGPSPAR